MCNGNCTCTSKPSDDEPLTLDAKLEIFDRNADQAVQELIEWMRAHPDDLIAVARGRHVTGHYRYRDKGLFEHDRYALRAEACEELADAIVYSARQIHLRSNR